MCSTQSNQYQNNKKLYLLFNTQPIKSIYKHNTQKTTPNTITHMKKNIKHVNFLLSLATAFSRGQKGDIFAQSQPEKKRNQQSYNWQKVSPHTS